MAAHMFRFRNRLADTEVEIIADDRQQAIELYFESVGIEVDEEDEELGGWLD